MWMILQADEPEDWVFATGITTTVRDFVKKSFDVLGITIEFKGEGIEEKGYVTSCSNPEYQLEKDTIVVEVDKRYFRPTEVEILIGDNSKATKKLGWKPQYSLEQLIQEMVMSDLDRMKKEKLLKEHGYQILNSFE
jgi:GDPmannose 4,6-dehydratase